MLFDKIIWSTDCWTIGSIPYSKILSKSQWEHQKRIEKAHKEAEAKQNIPEDWS